MGPVNQHGRPPDVIAPEVTTATDVVSVNCGQLSDDLKFIVCGRKLERYCSTSLSHLYK